MTDSLLKSVERVIDTIRGRRGPSEPAATTDADATPTPAPAEIVEDVPQLHLSATAAKAAKED